MVEANLRGTSPVGRVEGDRSYVARTVGKHGLSDATKIPKVILEAKVSRLERERTGKPSDIAVKNDGVERG